MRYEIELDGVDSRAALHTRLRAALPLPAWYGDNLDALYDSLSEMPGPYEIVLRNEAAADEGMREYLAALRRMLRDLSLSRLDITIRWEDRTMSAYLEKAAALRNAHDVHYNCAQAALIPFAADADIAEDTAYRLAANFGAGMKRASVCGAITGGLMALGLLGLDDPATVGEYYRRLRENHDGLFDCADLLRADRERGGDKKTHCDGMVYECVALVEELARDKGRIQ